MALHKDLTDSDLHELKGASGASADMIPVADGAGSTTFKKLTIDSIDTTSIKDTNKIYLSVLLDSPAAAFDKYIPIPFNCTLDEVSGVTSAQPSSDLTIVFYNTAEPSSIGSITFASTGTVPMYSATSISSGNSITSGGYIKLSNSGVSTSGSVTLVFLLTLT